MLLSEKDRTAIRERLQGLTNPVTLQFTEATLNCPTCPEVKQLLEELCELSDLLTLETYNLYVDTVQVQNLKITKTPAISITDETRKDYGIRFYGAPAGYEFATLLQDILMVSSGDSGLQPATREALQTLTKPVDLAVFVTPTCPYCPAAVHLAHQFAFESLLVVGNMVEATEFPEWSNEFNVYGVPKTVMNQTESLSIEGAVPESALLDRVISVEA